MRDNPKLSFDDQILWLKNHGVRIEDDDTCKNYLKNKTYFYKLIGYVKNLNSNDKTVIDSFEKLVDISTLDMELRYCLLPICLDIEHWIKTYILRLVTNNPTENGYHIVNEVINSDNDPEDFKRKLFSSVSYYDENHNFVVQPKYQEFYDEPPIWIILEIASLGKLRSFIKYMSNKREGNKDLRQINESIKYINKLRNSCAHNRELLTKDIYPDYSRRIPHNIYSGLMVDDFERAQLYKPLFLKIALALRIHKRLCSEDAHKHRIKELQEWLDRSRLNKKYYGKNDDLAIFFSDIDTLINTYK